MWAQPGSTRDKATTTPLPRDNSTIMVEGGLRWVMMVVARQHAQPFRRHDAWYRCWWRKASDYMIYGPYMGLNTAR